MSTIKVTTIQNLAGVEVYTAKAWVNFNGTGTVAIRASGNVSSITDGGTGTYTVNFTVAMPDENYAPLIAAGETSGGIAQRTGTRTAAGIQVFTTNPSTLALLDMAAVFVGVLR